MEKHLKNREETLAFAQVIGEVAIPQDVLVLTGDLAAGKTTFTKGIALGLGISQMIKSPTYTIIREYSNGRIPLYHMDVYRVEKGADDLGLDDYFSGDGLSVVEWGKLLGNLLPEDYVEIFLKKTAYENERVIQMNGVGLRGQSFYQRILEKF